MTCRSCRSENAPDAKFCEECGASLARVCPHCQKTLSAKAKFCSGCGQPVAEATTPSARFASPQSYTPRHLADRILTSRAALEGERKQVTVLFADLKGSMDLLADRDPEQARDLLDPVLEHMMEAVHRYEGTVNQVMGDGIMALFGAPLAHEDHAVRACYAALRMQETVKRYAEGVRREHGVTIRIRVGLNSGEVVVRAIGSDLHMDYTAVGQTTHLAARMEQLADPGSILLTADTLAPAEGFVQVNRLGPMAVKGLPAPVEVYELVGASAVRSRLEAAVARGLSRFVGRDAELEQLRRALDQAGRGHGQVAAIVGEPGVGKSRLVFELTHSHRVDGWLVLEASSVSYGKATSYLPVTDLLRRYFRIADRDTYRDITEKVTGKILTLDRALEPTLPALLGLLDVPIEDPRWSALDPAQRRRRTLDAVKRVVLRETQAQPLVLVFEDLHWIDSDTQMLLDDLVESLPAARVLLLVNYRPEYGHGWGGKTYYAQIRLDTLPPESTGELLASLLGEDASLQPLHALLASTTAGNPFFLEESVRTLVETRALVGERGAYRLAQPVDTLRVPATVHAILASRIDRLLPEDKQLLETAAAIGKDFPFALLQAVADEDDDTLRARLGRLRAAEFVYETSLFPDLEFTFKHALTHQVAYDALLHERRTRLHARIVTALTDLSRERITDHVEALAHHALRGELWREAVTWAHRAGLRSFSRAANREAVVFFRQALSALAHLPPDREVREQGVDIRLALRHPLFALGDQDGIRALLDDAERLAIELDDAARRVRVLTLAANYHWYRASHDEAIAASARALSIADEVSDLGLRVASHFRYGQASHAAGQYAEAVEHLRAAAHLLDGPRRHERFGGPTPSIVTVQVWSAWCFAECGRFADGIGSGEEAIHVSEEVGDYYALTHACFGLGYVHLRHGDLGAAIAVLERGVALCETYGFTAFRVVNAAELGYAYCLAGRTTEGLAVLEEAVTRAESLGMLFSHSLWLAFLGEAALLAGHDHRTRDAALQALDCARSRRERGHEAWALRLLALETAHRVPVAADGAESAYREALGLATDIGMRPLVAHCHLGLGELFRRTGKRGDAAEHLAAAASLYREMAMLYWLEKAEAELARVRMTP